MPGKVRNFASDLQCRMEALGWRETRRSAAGSTPATGIVRCPPGVDFDHVCGAGNAHGHVCGLPTASSPLCRYVLFSARAVDTRISFIGAVGGPISREDALCLPGELDAAPVFVHNAAGNDGPFGRYLLSRRAVLPDLDTGDDGGSVHVLGGQAGSMSGCTLTPPPGFPAWRWGR